MDNYSDLKKELFETLSSLEDLFSKASDIPAIGDRLFMNWESSCNLIRGQLSEDIIRVAVVGSIKSGKSTLVNAFVKGDYLKRGAGVVTSFVTRIRGGKSLKSKLFFKNWDEVNSDIKQATVFLPNFTVNRDDNEFDIRRSGDRMLLERSLNDLKPDQLVSNGAVDANTVLLSSYLKGFERVEKILASDDTTLMFKGRQFGEHREFVASDPLSVYLKDTELEIVSDALTDYFEIADCQGSDSPNPRHLAMIQEYLTRTHLIVYVISSRTGLRQADIRFLSMIKKMGIMDNILFVVNIDLNEHESMNDLKSLILRVKEDLSYLKPEHDVFAFSALLNLFRLDKKGLSEKDARRLGQWEMERELAAYSDEQSQTFEKFLNQRLNQERYSLLLQNQLERMNLMATSISHWVRTNQTILSRDNSQIEIIVDKISAYHDSIDKIKGMIQNTLGGSMEKLKRSLRTDLDQFFEQHDNGIIDIILRFVRNFDIRVENFGPELEQMGFANAMYRVYQEFKQAMDMFMADTINPMVIRFIREKEKRVVSELNAMVDSYEVMIQNTMVEFDRGLEQIGIAPMEQLESKNNSPQLETVKSIAGIVLPSSAATLRYSAKIKAEAVMKLGLYSAVKIMKQILKKPAGNELDRQKNALRDGGQRMKRETEKSIRAHLKDYRENIKFQYLLRLVDAYSETLKNAMTERYQVYTDNLLRMIDSIKNRKLDKTRAATVLNEMGEQALVLENRIRNLQEDCKTIKE